MAKSRPPKAKTVSGSPDRLDALIREKRFPAALVELDKIRRADPDFQPPMSEADLWSFRGQMELDENQWRAAENSFRQAIKLGGKSECYYFAAKALLRLNRLDSAVALLKEAFEADKLTKEFDLCYPKLLLMKEDSAAVADLLAQYPQRFDADARHWLEGSLAFLDGRKEEALTHFAAVARDLTPGDHSYVWEIFGLHQLGRYEEAARKEMELEPDSEPGQPLRRALTYGEHECLQCFALFHWLRQGETPLNELMVVDGYALVDELWDALCLFNALKSQRYALAAHYFLQLDNSLRRLPELQEIQQTLLLLAGQEAKRNDADKMAQEYWLAAWNDKSFNPQLAINLAEILKYNEAWPERQRVLTRLLKWLEEEGKRNPRDWPADLLNYTLAHIHCWLAYNGLRAGRHRLFSDELQRAERLCPQSPETLGYRGILAYLEDEYEKAISLLTSALEGGTESYPIYSCLEELLEDLKREPELAAMRTRFGPRFGEAAPEAPPFEPWELALGSLSYDFFSFSLEMEEDVTQPVRMCRLFIMAVKGEANANGKVSFDQARVKKYWQSYLSALEPTEQALCLEAILACLCLFAKREKGVAALTKDYLDQLKALGAQVPAAQDRYLALLALKEKKLPKVIGAVKAFLDGQPQRANALARLQLRYRLYAEGSHRDLFRPLLEDARQKEPQNPLLLLALATSYPPALDLYTQLREESFELARRLQDAEALAACRQEDYLQRHRQNQDLMLRASRLNEDEPELTEAFFKDMIARMLGDEVPEEEIERRLPELMNIFLEEMGQEEDEPEVSSSSSSNDFFDPFARGRKKRRR
ncbi:MAG: tetratricopeptide repeat protein [Cyanobacteriota bacterium]